MTAPTGSTPTAPTVARPRRRIVAVASDVTANADAEISLDAFRDLLLELTGTRVPGLNDGVAQSDPVLTGSSR